MWRKKLQPRRKHLSKPVKLTIHGDLAFFTDGTVVHEIDNGADRSVKDLIEARGVPHPEVMRILVNGQDVDFDYLVQEGDGVEVFPAVGPTDFTLAPILGRPALPRHAFLADVHLGKLVRYLRMLGLDCYYDPPWDDEILAATCASEQRIMLTRDRGLLKRRCINFGFFLRSDDSLLQAQEVLERVELSSEIKLFSRCPSCNGALGQVEKEDILDLIPLGTRRNYDRFYQCGECSKVYWRGAHFKRLTGLVKNITGKDSA